MSRFTDPELVLAWTARIAGIGILLDSLEQLAISREFREGGVFAWTWLRTSRAVMGRRSAMRRLMDAVFAPPVLLGLIAMRAGGAMLLIVAPGPGLANVIGLLPVFVAGSLLNLRDATVGGDTANAAFVFVTGALLLGRMAPNSTLVARACVWFIALQACTSYATAGVSKLRNPGWRAGAGLFNVARSTMNGTPPAVAAFLEQHQTIARTLTWLTVAMECAFPVVLLGMPRLGVYVLAWGVLFHLAVAILLGMNTFFWAWMAMYPALAYVTR
jgi:hypothetical protein